MSEMSVFRLEWSEQSLMTKWMALLSCVGISLILFLYLLLSGDEGVLSSWFVALVLSSNLFMFTWLGLKISEDLVGDERLIGVVRSIALGLKLTLATAAIAAAMYVVGAVFLVVEKVDASFDWDSMLSLAIEWSRSVPSWAGLIIFLQVMIILMLVFISRKL
jgi:hypothetical protein